MSKTLGEEIAGRIAEHTAKTEPFTRVIFEDVFPADVYPALVEHLPVECYEWYNHPDSIRTGKPTRLRLDLTDRVLPTLPPVWIAAARALSSDRVRDAIRDVLGIETMDGLKCEMHLLRDVKDFFIAPHPDTERKAVTAQFYLSDAIHAAAALDTVFYEKDPDGGFREIDRAFFLPNAGYAFRRSDVSFHGVEPLPEGVERDSLILRYCR